MAMFPEPMRRWGVGRVFIEAVSMVVHFRLFLPFFLVFNLPASILGAFQVVIVKVAWSHPALTSLYLFKADHSSSRQILQEDLYWDTDSRLPSLAVMMSICAQLGLVHFILADLALSSYAYIVKFIYVEARTESDKDPAIFIKKVFKLLPGALLRLFVTHLWWYLVLTLLVMGCLILAFILNVIWTAVAGRESGPNLALCLLFAGVPCVIGLFAMSIMFMLASCITVLEPENYGLAALKVSTKCVRGSFTKSIGIFLMASIFWLSIYTEYLQVVIREEPDWLNITKSILYASLYGLKVGSILDVVSVVTYFVLKSKIEAVLPETIQRGSIIIPASENPKHPT